jgi:hypothetical protein
MFHSTAHAQYYLVYNFAQAILHDEELKSKPALHKVMTTCFELFACYTMDSEASEFLASGYLSPKQAELLRNRVHALLAELRPQAVSLVDAWGVPDYLLNSALGRYDGKLPNRVFFPYSSGQSILTCRLGGFFFFLQVTFTLPWSDSPKTNLSTELDSTSTSTMPKSK